MDTKFEELKKILRGTGGVMVAFSGGVDSTFLLKVAHMVLKGRAIALTTSSPTAPPGELEAAEKLAKLIGCQHMVISSRELDNPSFSQNPANRCYFCKDELYRICRDQADRLGISTAVDGTNLDDLKDHRPGLKAAKEWRIRHPLVEARMTKEEIRKYSRELDLPSWDKPAIACLSSRFPYGVEINVERLEKIAACERFLQELRFREFRVRYHGDLVRIELAQEEIGRFFDATTREAIVQRFKEIGFTFVSLDLQGYRTGSMNEALAGKATQNS
ncbi:MAG: ATP-dependent sacrificial sulfur transferase LarE [Deltaproteobacteria bacterium]|nr:MAG: ATP-dependent sacrificial sulfur transferase LarE [Deltaproteobacteria bacterium]